MQTWLDRTAFPTKMCVSQPSHALIFGFPRILYGNNSGPVWSLGLLLLSPSSWGGPLNTQPSVWKPVGHKLAIHVGPFLLSISLHKHTHTHTSIRLFTLFSFSHSSPRCLYIPPTQTAEMVWNWFPTSMIWHCSSLLSVYFSCVYDCRTFVWNSVTGNKMHVIWYLAEHFWLEHSWTNQMWFETLKTPCFFNLYIVFLWSESPAAAHARGGQPSSSPLSLPRPVSILAPSIPVTSAHRAPAIGFLALRLRQTKIFYLGKPMFSAGQPLKWSRY